MRLHRHTPWLAAVLFVAVPAHAQNYRPDAEGYPCGADKRLAVVQDGQSFSIRRPEAKPAGPEKMTSAMIAIGAALQLDRRLFAPRARQDAEAGDATRR